MASNGSFATQRNRAPDPQETFSILMVHRQVTESSRRTVQVLTEGFSANPNLGCLARIRWQYR